jgi:hypothetical protein
MIDRSWRRAKLIVIDLSTGDRVVVRTHFHPAWQIRAGGQALTGFDEGGQLSFDAPATGSYDVELVYPARRWPFLCPLVALVLKGIVRKPLGLAW